MKKRLIIIIVLVAVAVFLANYLQLINLSQFKNDPWRLFNSFNIAELVNSPSSQSSDTPVEYQFAIISDTHNDTDIYPQIITKLASRSDIEFVAHLGDHGSGGEIAELQQSKAQLDRLPQPVYVLPGDHDLNWLPQRDASNFKQVFGLNQTSYHIQHRDEHFIFLDVSNSSQGLSNHDWQWLDTTLNDISQGSIYVFMSTPLSNPFLTFKEMGSQSQKVEQQARQLGQILKSHNVKAIFAGDTHTFSQYNDEYTGLPIVTVGAAGTNKNPLPMYVLVEILSDGGYNVTSIPFYEGNN